MGTRLTTTEVRGRAEDTFEVLPDDDETKPSILTTEFWAMLAGIAALIVIYNVADDPSLDLWRACLLGTMIGVAYIVSRGLAKSGSRNRHWRDHMTTR
jgi:hypothetical protein